jgi:hypothetical protein
VQQCVVRPFDAGHPSSTRNRLVLSDVPALTSEVENALFEARCDDATVGMHAGRMSLDFARSAPSLKDAILSAIEDVRKAKIGALQTAASTSLTTGIRSKITFLSWISAIPHRAVDILYDGLLSQCACEYSI